MKVALVHDDFMQTGGAEILFAEIAVLFPKAPIYTSLADWGKFPQSIDKNRIHTSWMQKIPFASKFYKALLPLYPFAFESFNFDKYDLVISSTARFAKSILTKPKTLHICYINSIPRFLYSSDVQKEYLSSYFLKILSAFINWLKNWDKVSSTRPDFYIANSENVKNVVKKEYGINSAVVYPFIDTNFFKPAKIHNWKLKSERYFLVVSRLVKWKKIDTAIKAATKQRVNLKIVGEGPDKDRLKRLGKEGVEFLGKVSREQLRTLYQNCQALIVTQKEDFGISTVEAQACARPVIAFNKGGQKEIIIGGKTGLFFESQSAQSLKDAINDFFKLKWSKQAVRRNSLRFSKTNFEKNLLKAINSHASRS